jgi:hypothetical protein
VWVCGWGGVWLGGCVVGWVCGWGCVWCVGVWLGVCVVVMWCVCVCMMWCLHALLLLQVVSSSSTPGHTKHIQTYFLSKHVCMCDAPGLLRAPACVLRAWLLPACASALPTLFSRDADTLPQGRRDAGRLRSIGV